MGVIKQAIKIKKASDKHRQSRKDKKLKIRRQAQQLPVFIPPPGKQIPGTPKKNNLLIISGVIIVIAAGAYLINKKS